MTSREQKKQNVIEVLNKAISMELQAIHQYMYQHFQLDDMDYGELAANLKLIAIDEMRHSEDFSERVKELGGDPTTDLAGPVTKGQTCEEIFAFNANEEDGAMEAYNEFLAVCYDNGDSTTAKLFEMIIEHEQDHFNYFDNVLGHIQRLGDAYLSRIAGTTADTGPSKGYSYVE
jgi:bacterioferritin